MDIARKDMSRIGIKMTWLTIRIDEELKSKLKEVAKLRRVSVSDIVRELIIKELGRLGYLSDTEMKAIGLRTVEKKENLGKYVGRWD